MKTEDTMTVLSIIPVSKARFRVMLDNQVAFVLYKGDLRHYEITVGSMITEEKYNLIRQECLVKRARERSLYLLDRKEYTANEMLRKLYDGGYSGGIGEEVISWLTEKGYIDDERYIRQYIQYRKEYDSRNSIRNHLLAKFVSAELIKTVMDELFTEETAELEEYQIKVFLQKKHYDPFHHSEEEKRRLFSALIRRGYRYEAIKKYLLVQNEFE